MEPGEQPGVLGALLGDRQGGDNVSIYAAPARAVDLSSPQQGKLHELHQASSAAGGVVFTVAGTGTEPGVTRALSKNGALNRSTLNSTTNRQTPGT